MPHGLLALVMILSLLNLSAGAEPLPLGTAVPAVTGTSDDGSPLDLGQYCRTGFALVYFYPKADTPGCTVQGCSLRDAYAALTAAGVRIVGVSTDTVAKQKAFRAEHRLPFPLVADTDKALVTAFRVPTTFGFAARQAFLFREGKLVWRDGKASTSRQAADVLEVLRTLPPTTPGTSVPPQS